MAKEIYDAILKDGKFYCGKCGESLGVWDEYLQITYKGESYTQFIRRCKRKGCNAKSHYEIKLKVNLDSDKFVFPFEECKKIKEEKKTFKEGENDD
jgi:hypothetical protein